MAQSFERIRSMEDVADTDDFFSVRTAEYDSIEMEKQAAGQHCEQEYKKLQGKKKDIEKEKYNSIQTPTWIFDENVDSDDFVKARTLKYDSIEVERQATGQHFEQEYKKLQGKKKDLEKEKYSSIQTTTSILNENTQYVRQLEEHVN